MEQGKNIYGQARAVRLLENIAASGNVPHALLFTGNRGGGKFFAALEFSLHLNKNVKNYQKISSGIKSFYEPYVKYIYPLPRGRGETPDDSPTAKLQAEVIGLIKDELLKKKNNPYYKLNIPSANNIKISSIRDIRKFISFEFTDIPYRVVIIEDAHLMNDQAQNALLKSLEEPPDRVIFILTTSDPGKLLPTIISRCWTIRFDPLSTEDIKEILQNFFSVESKIAEKAAIFSDGSVDTAVSLVENDINFLIDKTITILRFSLAGWYNTAFNSAADLMEENSIQNFIHVMQMLLKWIVDLKKFSAGIDEIYFGSHRETIEKFVQKFSHVEPEALFTKMDTIFSSHEQNVSLNIILMNIIFELATIGKKQV